MRVNSRHIRQDRIARWVISLGGVSIIGSMLLIILFMIWVILPLLDKPEQRLTHTSAVSEETIAFAPGPYGELSFFLDTTGFIRIRSLEDGRVRQELELPLPAGATSLVSATETGFARDRGVRRMSLRWDNGDLQLVDFRFRPRYNDLGEREIRFSIEARDTVSLPIDTELASGQRGDDGPLVTLLATSAETLTYRSSRLSEDFLGTLHPETVSADLEVHGELTAIAIREDGAFVFAGTRDGFIYAWDIRDPDDPLPIGRVRNGNGAITTMTFLYGETTVVTGDNRGELRAWNVLPGDPPRLARIHELPGHQGAIVSLKASRADKTLASLDETGILQISHLTSERLLVRLGETDPIAGFALNTRGDMLSTRDREGGVGFWALEIAHPEVSLVTLWGKVHYEGYPRPKWTWQSSSAADDFEPKMSLVPLVWGSLKGTFYGMVLALPLALMAAIYVSHMMHPRWRAVVKPVMELMAAVPSVVIGLLAALWLAPRLENNLLAVVFSFLFVPATVTLVLVILFRRGVPLQGYEFLWCLPLILLGFLVAHTLGDFVQKTYFDGDLSLWLFQNLGIDYEKRNGVLIAFALGFAVIPIVFTISEDALFNVPPEMTAASMALGGSRWQTMRYVILPAAGPGIFAAVMIGLGRAVGETMIVLMATGNTPIMTVNMLDGMRTISANLAVEIPEAPVGSSLYRVLFLSAVLLFSLTFLINTLAEVVRMRLQKRFRRV